MVGMALALASGTSVLLTPALTLAYPIDINPTLPPKSQRICISVVDFFSNQLTVKSIIDLHEPNLIEPVEMSVIHQKNTSIDSRVSQRHR